MPTRPRDLPSGGGVVLLQWRQRRWRCRTEDCPEQTFTEQVPAGMRTRPGCGRRSRWRWPTGGTRPRSRLCTRCPGPRCSRRPTHSGVACHCRSPRLHHTAVSVITVIAIKAAHTTTGWSEVVGPRGIEPRTRGLKDRGRGLDGLVTAVQAPLAPVPGASGASRRQSFGDRPGDRVSTVDARVPGKSWGRKAMNNGTEHCAPPG